MHSTTDAAAPADRGAVTFLFTDIEGSTQLWERQTEVMRVALARHDAILRTTAATYHGHVFKTIGDAFCVAFGSASEAVLAAVQAQRALQKEVPQLRVRMAVHTGAAEAREGDYFGPAVNRVSRLLAAGHGGQMLLSQSTADLLSFPLPDDTRARPLGVHRLRDIPLRETVYQLQVPGLPVDFPPLNTLDVAYHRGLLRAAAAASVVLAIVAGLAGIAVRNARRADEQRWRAEQSLYAAHMLLAQQAWEVSNVARARELLEEQRPRYPGQEDLRGFEWRYLWRLARGDQLFILGGHTGGVTAVAVSPDGKALVTGGADKTVRLWDIVRRRELGVVGSQGHRIQAVAFAPDGRMVASAAEALRLWDVVSRRQVALLEGHRATTLLPSGENVTHRGWLVSVAFSPDGRRIATGGQDGIATVWDVATRREVATLRGRGGGVYSLAFSPDGRLLATSELDKTAKLWDVASRRVVTVLEGQGYFRSGGCLSFSPNSRLIATGTWYPEVKLWDVASGRLKKTLSGHTASVRSVAFSPDGRLLASASADKTVRVWDVASGREQAWLRGHMAPVNSVSFCSAGRQLVTGSQDGTIRLWEASGRPEPAILKVDPRTPSSCRIALSPDGKILAAGSWPGALKLWDVASRRVIRTLGRDMDEVFSVAFSPDGKTLAYGVQSFRPSLRTEVRRYPPSKGRESPVLSSVPSPLPEVRLWDRTTQRVATLPGHSWRVSPVFSPDGMTLAVGGDDGLVKLWDLAPPGGRPRERSTLRGHQYPIVGLSFSPDGKLIASGSNDMVRLWDVATSRTVATPDRGSRSLGDVVFSPDGRSLAYSTGPGGIRLWDLATRRERTTLKGHSDFVLDLAFSPDGKTLASGSLDHTVKLWSIAAGQEVATLRGHSQGVSNVAFSSDGDTLATAGSDGTVRFWRAATFAETGASGGAPRPQSSR
jgi:WD40 repeat protein/class 3 adenylate cyclase